MIRLPNPPVAGEQILPWARAVHAALRMLLPGFDLSRRSTRQTTAGETTAPFRVSVAKVERVDGEISAVKLIVEKNSWLMATEKCDDKVTITGLGAEFEVEADDKVWLEVSFDASGDVTAATIEHGEGGVTGEWEPFPDVVEYDDPDQPDRKQTKAFHLLAYLRPVTAEYDWERVTFPDDEERQLVSTTATNLIICRKCYEPDGELIRTLAPWFTPYFNPDP